MLRRHASGFRALLMLTDGALAGVLLVALSIVRFEREWLDHWQVILQQPAALAFSYAALWIVILWLHGMYRPRARWTIRSEGLAIGRATVVLALLTLSVLFVFRLPDVSRLYLLALFPSQWLLTLATRIALRFGFEQLRRRGYNVRFVLIVGAGERAQSFAAKLESHRELGLRILGFIDDAPHRLRTGWRRLGTFDDLETILHSEAIDEVAICLPYSDWDRMNAITHVCEEEGKIVRVPVDMLDRAFAAGRFEELDGTPVYSLVSGPDRAAALFVKRLVDVAVSGSLLVILSPVFGVLALAVRLREGSPVLFRQRRVGLHGRSFEVLKLRTMTPDAEERYAELVDQSDPRAFKLTDDPRITPIGRFLRRSSLDELPQLWNVFKGEMSLVGPRPAPPREVEGYDLWHRRRLSMKPGITGLWQVTARRSLGFDDRASLDISYIDRWSLWLDMKILARTIPAAFEGR
ncbi:MAG TPA: sugar transferase [Candidatus Dormibacteraeota bacterium]|nr:sugar transferase [Candidatus Dormibacteraeota bacterium]